MQKENCAVLIPHDRRNVFEEQSRLRKKNTYALTASRYFFLNLLNFGGIGKETNVLNKKRKNILLFTFMEEYFS